MTRFLALMAAVALVVFSADPASAGWRRCGCRGFYGGRWGGGYVNGQQTGYYNANSYQPQQQYTAGYPPANLTDGAIQQDATVGASVQANPPQPIGQQPPLPNAPAPTQQQQQPQAPQPAPAPGR